jgi:pyruvate dehydrogenase (quinone)
MAQVADYVLSSGSWEQALLARKPVVLEFKVHQEVAPLPPHIMKSQAKKAVKAWVKNPERIGITVRGFPQKLAEFYEMLPGRSSK